MTKPFTQQGAFRRERAALQRARSNNLTDMDIIAKMTQSMDNPGSATTVIQAAAAINYMGALCNRETPITDAVNAILKPSPDGAGEPA